MIGVEAARRSAAFYRAGFVVVEGAGHNLMMDYNARQTAQAIHEWLAGRGVA